MMNIEITGRTIVVETPAKINLTLRVLGKRPDGYHDLESVVAAVGLRDRLTFRPAAELSLTCDSAIVPLGNDNLIIKAAQVLAEACGRKGGAAIHLEKRIPPGRGFGGGSSDAAAALAGLALLWKTGHRPDELACLGARIGSDVPLFFGSVVSVMRGRGERIERLTARPSWWTVLAWPDYGLPTVDVYKAYDALPPQDGQRPAATEILRHLKEPAKQAGPFLINDLEPAAESIRPDGPELRAILEQAGAPAVGMTGSGSAYFALTDTETEARHLAQAARGKGAEAVIAPILAEGKTQQEASHESYQCQH